MVVPREQYSNYLSQPALNWLTLAQEHMEPNSKEKVPKMAMP
jgi:hypothetical protein